jgi:hypothetical protein
VQSATVGPCPCMQAGILSPTLVMSAWKADLQNRTRKGPFRTPGRASIETVGRVPDKAGKGDGGIKE